jgi:glycosyltransferase involved in cell wall biosynthesis
MRAPPSPYNAAVKVGIDARALLSERTGIGVYTEEIARGLSAISGIEVILFAPKEIPRGAVPPGVRTRTDRHPFGTVWVQTLLPRRLAEERVDVLLSAVTIAPVRLSIPSVPVVHDLTPLTHPEWHRRKTVVAFLPWIEKTIERAARVIAVSPATAAELAARFPDVRDRITVIPHGVGPRFSADAAAGEAEAIRREYTQGRPYVLSFATLEPRKNLGALVAAFERLWRDDENRPDLLLAGGAGWKSETLAAAIAGSPHRGKIHRPGYVAAEAVPALFRAAEAFCYPSHAEGFGLPVLEAMACGTPAVISTAPALLDLAGDAALSVPAEDVGRLAEALASVLDDPAIRRRCSERGLARAALFRWSDAAQRTSEALRVACAARSAA